MTDHSPRPASTDPEIELAGQNLHPSTGGAADGPSSLQALTRITSGLGEINEQVASFIVSSVEDTWKEERFLSLVNSYLKSSSEILNLCASVDSCSQSAKLSMLLIWYAVKLFEREAETESQEHVDVSKVARLLEDLKGFKAVGGDPLNEELLRIIRLVYGHPSGNKHRHMCVLEELKATAEPPFDPRFFELFRSVSQQQMQLSEKLDDQNTELWKKVKRIRRWRRVSNTLFAVGFFSVPVLTALVLVVPVTSAVEVLIGAFSATIGSIGKWCSYSLNKRFRAAEQQKDRIQRIKRATYLMQRDMDCLHAYTQKLEIVIEYLMQLAQFALETEDREEVRVRFAIDEMRRRLDPSLQAVEDINQTTSSCRSNITTNKKLVSEKLEKRLSRSHSKIRNWLEIFM